MDGYALSSCCLLLELPECIVMLLLGDVSVDGRGHCEVFLYLLYIKVVSPGE